MSFNNRGNRVLRNGTHLQTISRGKSENNISRTYRELQKRKARKEAIATMAFLLTLFLILLYVLINYGT
jgi:hypothetical protein